MDEPLEKCRWKAEYDGNIQTAPDNWPDVTLRLAQPQVVTHIRFIPKSADNNINVGDTYSLYVWNDSQWEILKTVTARYNFIPAENLTIGKFYWLRNRTRGKEELPFILDENGLQLFPHYELLKEFKQ